jgi:tetratricopeptide (TPR) repeat protein
MLTRLSLGRLADALELAPAVVALAPNPEDWFLFTMLHALLRTGHDGNGAPVDPVLQSLKPEDERRLLGVLRSLGHIETATQLLGKLASSRLDSPAPRHTFFETQLLAAHGFLQRCDWGTAERYLNSLTGHRDAPPTLQAAYFNLLGCTTCLCQDCEGGIRWFQSALRLAGADYAIHQNLAVAHEWLRQHDKAELHWNRFFDLADRRRTASSERPDYWARLMFEGFVRLGTLHQEKERWQQALNYLEAAQRLRPDTAELLERLFQLYQQVRRPDQARRVLHQLQQLRPHEPQFELYELDLIEINELDDLERWLAEVTRILQRHAQDPRVEERGVLMLSNAVGFLNRLSDQLSEQLNRVMKQVRSLDNYQINWSAVHDVMRDLKREFQKVRRLVGKCHTLATHAEQRRVLRELAEHLDRQIDYCRRWQGE